MVGALPQGLPSLALPTAPLTTLLAMILPAIGVLLVAYSEALGVAHEFAEKHGYEVDANQELNAHAAANLASAFFGGMLAAGSMSASAVKEGAGARSQVTNLVTWGATIVTLLFLTPLFAPLPEAVLAALIIHAVWHIIGSRKLQKLAHESRVEVWFGVAALAGVVLVDVLEGHDHRAGRLAGLRDLQVEPAAHCVAGARARRAGRVLGPGAPSRRNTPVPGVLIVRLDSQLYFANALTVRDRVKAMMAAMTPPAHAVIFDANAQDEIDVTSTKVLRGLLKELHAQGIAVYVAHLHEPVLAHGRKTGLIDAIGEEHIFPTVDLAVRSIENVGAV
jgi:SulP family sulfate permease